MRDCPQCGFPVDGVSCRNCGSAKAGTAAGESRKCAEPICNLRGNFQESTLGEGPRYCARHYPPFLRRAVDPHAKAKPETIERIHDLLRRTWGSLPQDDEKISTMPSRQPGEDDE